MFKAFKKKFGLKRSAKTPLILRLGAVLSTATVMFSIGAAVFADIDMAAPSATPTQGAVVETDKGKISEINDGSPTVSLSHESDAEEHRYKISPDAPVLINDSPSSVSELRPGDELTVFKDAEGRITKIVAQRADAGIVMDIKPNSLTLSPDLVKMKPYSVAATSRVIINGHPSTLNDVKAGDDIKVLTDKSGQVVQIVDTQNSLLGKFWTNFRSNLFKPLLLFFYLGFCVPLLRVAFEFPKAIYQGLTIYLLASIGWHGGEELAVLNGSAFQQALIFMIIGFATNAVIGFLAYFILRVCVPRLRKIDAATVAAYYGSDSAGTFVTCLGVLQAAHIASAAYMPVMLAVMEIPGCLVGLTLAASMRRKGMDRRGNMPEEPGYKQGIEDHVQEGSSSRPVQKGSPGQILREVFLNPGLFLLFGGIFIGYVSRLQGYKTVQANDLVFVSMFQGLLCLFLLEMGMTAARRLRDLRTVNWTFIAFGLLAPNLFAGIGLVVAMLLSHALHQPFQLGTYVLFAVLCGASSYIAVPAVQRLAIPEASPSLPLAASLGLTFSYNVTIGIPVYLLVARILMRSFPVT